MSTGLRYKSKLQEEAEESLKPHQRILWRYRILFKILFIIFAIWFGFYILNIWEEIGLVGWLFSSTFAGVLLFIMLYYNAYLDRIKIQILEYKMKQSKVSSIYNLLEFRKES